jgi:hypothetical protein
MSSISSLRRAQAKAWSIWTAASAMVGLLAFKAFDGSTWDEGLIALGVVFAVYVVLLSAVAGRVKDVSTLLVVVWGGTFGMWCERWLEAATRFTDRTIVPTGVIPDGSVEAVGQSLAIAGAGVVSAALLLVATKSLGAVWMCLGASLAAASVPMLASDPAGALPWAAFGWHAAVAASLAVWAVDEVSRRAGGNCGACGVDVAGLSSPVCPGCTGRLGNIGVASPVVRRGLFSTQ